MPDVPPGPDEAVALRAANARLREVIAAKDTEVAVLRAQLEAYHAQLEELRAEVEALRARVRVWRPDLHARLVIAEGRRASCAHTPCSQLVTRVGVGR